MTNPPAPQASFCILYDGECPMCSAFAKFADDAAGGRLSKIDARQDSPLRARATASGMDLDYGIVVESQGHLYYGVDALSYLAAASQKNLKTTLLYLPFRFHRLTCWMYPILVWVRWMILRLKRRSLIRNLTSEE